MLDINLSHYNEMLRYEPLMDELRALAVIIIGREQEDLFNIIKYYSRIRRGYQSQRQDL